VRTRMPSISRILVRIVMMAPGTMHGTQQCSPMRFDILDAQHIGQQNTKQPTHTRRHTSGHAQFLSLSLLFPTHSRFGRVRQTENFGEQIVTSQMPFLTPNQQFRSTKHRIISRCTRWAITTSCEFTSNNNSTQS